MKALLGKKIGMTRIFTADGDHVPVTVISAGPCYITQIKTENTDGYNALQLGFEEMKEKHATKALLGHFLKANVKPLRHLKEFRFTSVADCKLGDVLSASIFVEGESVHVSSYSKGRGFTGVMKRYGFAGVGGETHGQSDRQRSPGSIGSNTFPSRVFKFKKMSGHMGTDRVQVRNLAIVKVDAEKNLIFIKGSVPGARNAIVEMVLNA